MTAHGSEPAELGRFKIIPHPTPSPAALALAPVRPTLEAAVADMGDGVVLAPDGHIAAFHESHLRVIEHLLRPVDLRA